MPDSVSKQLRSDMECEGLLECFHGHKPLDRTCFEVLVESEEPLTIDEIGEATNRERSTAYRAVQRLLQSGLISKEQVNYDQGGYYHVYQPTDPEQVVDEMQRMLNDWYAKVGQLIQEFEDKYNDTDPSEPNTTSN
ncbi:HTH domain-containing protein [Halorubrum sp. BOL3-1]|uniref:helix-turn-helix domain-containing protein n=1 Tax=Halorubrum sp. BOL3-1 TaxID=2497325 RepID=UPI0010050223|nr:helix-turn-helix domain-containing protein [Halorubrum sp. BOL3-1]QAU14202.1 HTH domain-containing protein [Halorubrum sp. BOL3-1]